MMLKKLNIWVRLLYTQYTYLILTSPDCIDTTTVWCQHHTSENTTKFLFLFFFNNFLLVLMLGKHEICSVPNMFQHHICTMYCWIWIFRFFCISNRLHLQSKYKRNIFYLKKTPENHCQRLTSVTVLMPLVVITPNITEMSHNLK